MENPGETSVLAHLILTDVTVLHCALDTLLDRSNDLSHEERVRLAAMLRRRVDEVRDRIAQLPDDVGSAVLSELSPLLSVAGTVGSQPHVRQHDRPALEAVLRWRPSAARTTIAAIQGIDVAALEHGA